MQSISSWLFDNSNLIPHGFCLLWRPYLVWTEVISDGIIAASYLSISIVLWIFAVRRADLAFSWLFILFGTFILFCGLTHVMEAVTFWVPAYGIETVTKMLTAAASLGTAMAIWPFLPKALSFPSINQLNALNQELAREITERHRTAATLHDLNQTLEATIGERTSALTLLNEELQAEIAEHKRTEVALSETAALLRTALDTAPVAITVLAPDWTVLMWNHAAEEIIGYTATEMIGKSVAIGLTEEDLPAAQQRLELAMTGLPMRNMAVRRRNRAGKWLDLTVSWAHTLDSQGKIRSVVYSFEDVTERNLRDQQLLQSQKMEAIGQLTGGVSHDFNNLLAIIQGNIELIAERITHDADIGEMIHDVLSATEAGASLTQRLLAFSRKQPLAPRAVDIAQLITDMTELLRRSLGETISVVKVLPADLWETRIDPNQLENALLNLALNARDAMPNGGQLTIEAQNAVLDQDYVEQFPETTPGRYILLAVSDRGVGMAPEVLQHALEPFFTTKSEGKGTGLGLSMVFGFIKQSGGHLRIYSEIGHGTTIRLYLPKARSQDERLASIEDEKITARGKNELILVVEDDAMLRKLAVRLLTSFGYRTIEAADGLSAIEILEKSDQIDLLFTDVVLPKGMTGLDVTRRAIEIIPTIKVLYTSGYTRNTILHNGEIDKGISLLVKPYLKADLAVAVRRLLDEASA